MTKLILLALSFILSVDPKPTVTVESPKSLGGYSKVIDDYITSKENSYTKEDIDLLAEVMYHENHCNGEYVMLLTGSVVLNRVKSKGYPNTIKEVLYQKGQYSTTKKFFTVKLPDYMYKYAKELLIFGSIAPEKVVHQSMNPRLGRVWKVIKGEYFAFAK